jgi:hypothetical protein
MVHNKNIETKKLNILKDFIIENIVLSYPGAIVFIYFGYRFVINTKNEVNEVRSNYPSNFGAYILSGFLGGIGFIVLGIIIIILNLMGKM